MPASHRDSVWREADQNKVVWVLVQFIPLVGAMPFYILVHPTLLDCLSHPTASDDGHSRISSHYSPPFSLKAK